MGFTRDVWMHRDIARAAGIEPELTPEHDGRIVATSSPNGRGGTGSRTRSP